MANEIRGQLDCDILEVEPQTAFEEDYNTMLERAREELDAIQQGNYPAVKTSMEDFESYDLVFVGYPIWWGVAPRIINTFIESHDLKGKTLVPFATSGGSGIGPSVKALKAAYPSLQWTEGRLLNRASEGDIRTWVEKLGCLR